MPPTLRSANSSPAGKSAIPDASPARKAPTCSKCGQLRLGHPRTGCPFADSPSKDNNNTSPTNAPLQDNISRAFSSMFLDDSPVKDRRRSGIIPLQPSETLASISSSAEEMLNDLTQPGFFSQETVLDDNKGSKDAARTPRQVRIKSGPKRLMPGTLMAPSWESSIDGFLDDERSGRDPKTGSSPLKSSLGVQTSFVSLDLEPGSSPLGSFSSPPATSSPTPVQRSQTLENRELLLSSLAQTSPASVYSLKRHKLDSVYASAKVAKLHVRVVDGNDTDEEDVLMVVGSDPHAVEKRYQEELDKLVKSPAKSTSNTTNNYFITETTDGRSGSSSTMKAVAGGVLVGMAGAWAGLAFS